MLSVLLPTYNDRCDELVRILATQCTSAVIDYEILVGDDGSTDPAVIAANSTINTIPGARLMLHGTNIGRAAIRNRLAREAKGDWLLFIDADMMIDTDDYITRYIEAARQFPDGVLYGSYTLAMDERHGLRYRYESAAAQKGASRHFCSSNFMIRRSLFLTHPFDESWKEYGYEDVLFCKTMKDAGIRIVHAGAPVTFTHWESNLSYMNKTEEALRVLWRHRDVLRGYSQILELALSISRRHLSAPLRLCYRLFGRQLRHWLITGQPSVKWFQLYRLLYLLRT